MLISCYFGVASYNMSVLTNYNIYASTVKWSCDATLISTATNLTCTRLLLVLQAFKGI